MKFRRLRTRIIVWVMGLSLALSLTLGALSCYGDYVSATEQVDTLLATSSEANALALHNYIDGLEREIVTIAASGGLTKTALSYKQRQDNLAAVLRARSDVSGLYTIGMDGISINDSDYTFEDSSGEDYSGEAFFINAASADGLWMDDPVYDDWTDNISLTVTYRFNDGQGFDGVIGMDIHYQVLMDIISQGKVGDTGYSVMVNSEGRFIAHPDEAYVLNEVNYLEDTGTEPSFSSALATVVSSQGDGEIKNVTLAGEEVSLYYHTLEETGWNLITIAKPEEFMGQFYASLRTTLLLTAACILIAVLISLYIGNNIARPVSEMTKRMQSFAEGDLHSPMPAVRSRDEIGVLHDALEESTRALAAYVQDITDKLGHIAAGDVTDSVDIAYAGDFAPIKEQLNRILDALNDVMASVKGSAQGVKVTADQMSMAAGQLSENTVHQAGTIDTLSGVFGNIKAGIEHTAKNTTDALDKTSRAKQALTISRTSMDNMLASMREIDNAAASIERIIKVIDDIAFQTNILALNAAVEAARAGQHGKGFAVVADEVRNLAGKSAESARQTGELISNTLRAVQNGTVTAGEAAAEMNGLDTLVEELAGLVQGIEKEANDQADAAGSLYGGIERLSSIVQNDSAMAEETAAAGQEMRDMADTLYRSLSYFTLREDNK